MTIKKLFAILILPILLCSCAENSAPVSSPHALPAVEIRSAESSIFNREISYSPCAPADGLSLPVLNEEINGAVQIDSTVYILSAGAVYSLDLAAGTSSVLFDTDAALIATDGSNIFTYSPGRKTVSEYGADGSVINEIIVDSIGADSVSGLNITDGFYVFTCSAGKTAPEKTIEIISRETGEHTLSKNILYPKLDLYQYKGDKLLAVYEDSTSSITCLGVFNAETGKTSKIRDINAGSASAAAYSPKTNTVLVYGIAQRAYNEIANNALACKITEYSLNDSDSILLDRYYAPADEKTKFFIGIYENLVTMISSADEDIKIYDYLNPPESITVLGYNTAANAVRRFEEDTGILVKEAYTDYDKLVSKVMSGDSDFDVFSTGSGFHNYINSDVYVDLSEIESLSSRISENSAVKLIVGYDGGYFGVPTKISNWSDGYDPDAPFYTLIDAQNAYFEKNIDISSGRYYDPDGKELYKLLKFVHSHPNGGGKQPFGKYPEMLSANVYLLSKNSRNREAAIRFLEYIYDSFSGKLHGAVPEEDVYPNPESIDNYCAEWRCRPIDIINPIFDARTAAAYEDMSRSELKKLAEETAAEVAKRINGIE